MAGGASAEYTIGSGGDAWSGNSSSDNTTQNQGTTNIELRQQVDDYISYWRADGNAKDENRTSANDGTLNGNANTSVTGKYNNASGYDGDNDYISVKNAKIISGKVNWTITAWIKTSAIFLDGGRSIYSERGATGNDIIKLDSMDSTNPNNAIITIRDDGGTLLQKRGTITINDGNWHYVVGTKSGTSVKLYVDGVQDGAAGTWSGTNTFTDSIESMIGNDRTYTSDWLGDIDDVRIYERALTNDEINLTMNQSKYTSGNLTAWHDALINNETYQIDVNVTTSDNTNYTLTLYNNDTDAYIQDWTAQTGNNSFTITGAKGEDTKANITLNGNTTATPELIAIKFFTQAVSGGSTLSFSGCNSTQGTVWQSGTSIKVSNVPCTSIVGIKGRLNNATLISNTSTGIWNLNASIALFNSTLYLNDSDISELRWDDLNYANALCGTNIDDGMCITNSNSYTYISNISIVRWNSTSNQKENQTNDLKGKIDISNGSLDNVSFEGIGKFSLYGTTQNITNISMNNSKGMQFQYFSNLKLENFSVKNITMASGSSFSLSDSNNITVNNITVQDTTAITAIIFSRVNDSYMHHLTTDRTGGGVHESNGQAIEFSEGRNSWGHDYYMGFNGRSSFSFNTNFRVGYFYNITIDQDGHNGLDIHPASDIRIRNITVTNSSGNPLYVTSGYVDLANPATNITIEDFYTNTNTLASFTADSDAFDVTLINGTSINGSVSCGGCVNFTMRNVTITEGKPGLDWGHSAWRVYFYPNISYKCRNCYAIDSLFGWIAVEDDAVNARRINSLGVDSVYNYGYQNISYYTDIYVTDINGNPLQATISFTDNRTSLSATDGNGNEKTLFITEANGHTSLPNVNRSNSPAIAYYDVNASDQATYHNWTVTVSKTGYITNNSVVLIPDSTWYRSNPDTYQNTTTIMLTVDTTFIPPTPISLANTTGNFWANHTWAAGAGNITDSFNVSHNGTWTNGSAITFSNNSVGAGNWSNITVFAWNNSGTGTLSLASASMNTRAPSATSTTTSLPNLAKGYVVAGSAIGISAALYLAYRRRQRGRMMMFIPVFLINNRGR